MNLKKFPRFQLTFGPTPIQHLKRLSEHLGGNVQLFAKREDCNSGLAYGGNKTRKLEYLIPEALEEGCDTLVSIGGIQSNQTRQVAAVAAHLGMRCVLVQIGSTILTRSTTGSVTYSYRGSWERTFAWSVTGLILASARVGKKR